MDGEIKSFFKVWILAITCLCYCYYISSKLPKGLLRFLSLLPIFYLFIILPLNLSSIHLCGLTSFLLAWLGIFKLLLFSFSLGPLSSPPPSKLVHFISIACLPIKIKSLDQNTQKTQNLAIPKSIKALLLGLIIYSYSYRQYFDKNVIVVLHCLHVYLQLELTLAICAIPAKAIFGFGLEPQFNEPYLATSLQDFWGRRWNLMVSSILRPTVYAPTRDLFARVIGRRRALLPAVVATFLVSGLMHEVIYYYITRAPPTWEVTWFFVLHGICVSIEVVVKKRLSGSGKWRVHRVVYRPLVVVFVVVTGVWLFWPQLLRNEVDEKVIWEIYTSIDFVKNKVLNLNAIE